MRSILEKSLVEAGLITHFFRHSDPAISDGISVAVQRWETLSWGRNFGAISTLEAMECSRMNLPADVFRLRHELGDLEPRNLSLLVEAAYQHMVNVTITARQSLPFDGLWQFRSFLIDCFSDGLVAPNMVNNFTKEQPDRLKVEDIAFDRGLEFIFAKWLELEPEWCPFDKGYFHQASGMLWGELLKSMILQVGYFEQIPLPFGSTLPWAELRDVEPTERLKTLVSCFALAIQGIRKLTDRFSGLYTKFQTMGARPGSLKDRAIHYFLTHPIFTAANLEKSLGCTRSATTRLLNEFKARDLVETSRSIKTLWEGPDSGRPVQIWSVPGLEFTLREYREFYDAGRS